MTLNKYSSASKLLDYGTLSIDYILFMHRSEGPYHLVYMFLTESNPCGGWWFSTDAQESEGEWLKAMLCEYEGIATKALSARIFGICCGVNLMGAGVMSDLVETVQG